jgi:hypothetical protein
MASAPGATMSALLGELRDKELQQLHALVNAEVRRRKRTKRARIERGSNSLAEQLAESVWLLQATREAP